jgi:PAS domain S-box-containing protein
MIRISNLTSLTKQKLKKLELSETEALLDIISEAALLIDGRNGQIVIVNAAATVLSAYTRAELTQMGINDLFAQTDNPNILEDIRKSPGRMVYWEFLLVKRGGGEINVRAIPTPLDRDSEKIVITFEPSALIDQRQAEKERLRQVWDGLQTLANALLETELMDALRLALEAG